MAPAVRFIKVGPGGLCFAHGPYKEGDRCPRWPDCVTDPHDPAYVAEGARRICESQERPKLEHSLATAFCAMQRTTDAGERQRGWLECLRLCKELEKLNADRHHNEPNTAVPDSETATDRSA